MNATNKLNIRDFMKTLEEPIDEREILREEKAEKNSQASRERARLRHITENHR
jgi:hypothetical protein